VTNVGDSFGWAFRDPAWAGKMLVQGLIAIIPIVGWIAMIGWMMLAFENLRGGRQELPPAGFHLGRGISLFVVLLIYGLVISIPAIVLIAIGGGVAAATSNHNASFSVGSPFIGLGYLIGFAAGIFLRFLTPSLIVNTYHGGIAGGLDVGKVWRTSTLNVTNTVVAAVVIWVASLIGGFGLACCIGFIFTVPYENTINAGTAAWFERGQAGPA
jgi:hypothetical protein